MRVGFAAFICLLSAFSQPASGYESRIHQQLTFIAARQFNNCVNDLGAVERFSALDTRYIVKANASQAGGSFFGRIFRWSYYNRDDQSGRSMLGMVDTRFHDHFETLVDETRWTVERDKRLKNLGRLINYIQEVTSPARVVPVYTGRWWRFSLGDRFDRFEVDAGAVEAAVDGACSDFMDLDGSFHDVLIDAATRTLSAVRSPIYGFPTTWEAFWRLAEEDDEFGDYGPAGNAFGERTEFRCAERERCLLLENDPLYQDFATARHVQAVISTMRAMALMQQEEAERAAEARAD